MYVYVLHRGKKKVFFEEFSYSFNSYVNQREIKRSNSIQFIVSNGRIGLIIAISSLTGQNPLTLSKKLLYTLVKSNKKL